MTAHPHLDTLKERHSALERAIREEEARPSPDDISIGELKRRRLQIKERIHRFATDGS
jgi:hypothetical protein